MLKNLFSLCLTIVFLCAYGGAQPLAKDSAAGSAAAEKIKRKVLARGTGVNARVRVELRDGSKVKGYVNEAASEHFVVVRTDDKIGQAIRIDYGEAKELKGYGKGLSPSTSDALIETGISVSATVVTVYLFVRLFRGRT